MFRYSDFIEGGNQWWSNDGKELPSVDDEFGQPPFEGNSGEYINGPTGEGWGAGNDGVSVSGDVDETRINHSKN